MPTRRALLSLAVLQAAAAPAPALPDRPVLVPGRSDAPQRDAQLCLAGGARFFCPPIRARLLAVLPMRSGTVMAIGFGCDYAQASQDLVALAGADGALLALERLNWNSQGMRFTTSLAMTPDRSHLALTRQIVTDTPERLRESWTDYLQRTPQGLPDHPARPIAEATFQMMLARQRQTIAALLPPDTHNIRSELLAALRTTPFAAV